ncbi:MAG TPA: hypothetical protein VKW78_03400 [Terriglobales bacterium]|jgi:hypothetical protein|nr:hypothetical protein [Terriglobales bacterium]
MRNRLTQVILGSLAVFAIASFAFGQEQQARPRPRRQLQPGYVAEGVPEMPNPPGPAPKHDISGAWVGPQNVSRDAMPPMTAAGEAKFKQNHPYVQGGTRDGDPKEYASNDPFIVCDPLGFPRDLLNHAVSSRGGMIFLPGLNRMFIMFEQQRVWREVWMDGRELPKDVDAKGAPDSRYYGYSVGHWDGDNTFVIDTTGFDQRAWLDENGHPKSKNAHIEERYTRADQYNLQLVATLDDPKFYTKPWVFLKANYYWMKDQDFEETLCIPSEGIEYRDTLARPSGISADTSSK